MRYAALLIVGMVLVGVFASTASAEITEVSIHPSESAQMASRIYDNLIVWEDYRNSPGGVYLGPGTGNPDIYLYNISSGREEPICTEQHAQQSPDIWDHLIVWEDYRNGNADIYIYDTSDPAQPANGTRLTFNSARQVQPKIWGKHVVWIDYRNGLDGDIYFYDLSVDSDGDGIPNWKDTPYGAGDAEMAIKPVCANIYEQRDVAIYGDTVVWKDYRNDTGNGDRNIFGYRLSTEEEFQITTEKHNQFQPAIYENTVVWVDMRDGVSTIYGKNIETGREFTIAPDGNAQNYPDIYGDIVVWSENTGNRTVIMLSKIGNEESRQITGDWPQMSPSISSAGVVWADGRDIRQMNGRDFSIWNIYFLRSSEGNMPPEISDVNIGAPDGFSYGKSTNISITARVYDPEGDNFTVFVNIMDESYRMYDDGMHGDGDAGDGTYGALLNITPKSKELLITIDAEDDMGASSMFTKSIEVSGAPNPVMALIGLGAVILVLVAIIAGVYFIRKKSLEMDEKHEKEKEKEGSKKR